MLLEGLRQEPGLCGVIQHDGGYEPGRGLRQRQGEAGQHLEGALRRARRGRAGRGSAGRRSEPVRVLDVWVVY